MLAHNYSHTRTHNKHFLVFCLTHAHFKVRKTGGRVQNHCCLFYQQVSIHVCGTLNCWVIKKVFLKHTSGKFLLSFGTKTNKQKLFVIVKNKWVNCWLVMNIKWWFNSNPHPKHHPISITFYVSIAEVTPNVRVYVSLRCVPGWFCVCEIFHF